MRYSIANLGQQEFPWPWGGRIKPLKYDEVIVVAPKRPPPPPPPTPPLSFMTPPWTADAPVQPPGPPKPPPPPGKPVATPGRAHKEDTYTACYRCADGSYKMMSYFDAKQNNPGCKWVSEDFCKDWPADPGEPTITPIVEDRPMVPSVDPIRPYRPNTPTPGRPTPTPIANLPKYDDVATPGGGMPYEGAGGPGVTGEPVSTPSLPPYATNPQPYKSDYQKQVESYTQKLKEFSDRPATPTIYDLTRTPAQIQEEALRRSTTTPGTTGMTNVQDAGAEQYSWNRAAGQPPANVASVDCGPGQFWDGRQCRGSVAPSAASLVSQAMNLGPSGANMPGGGMMPGGYSSGGAPPAYSMGRRYPVVNL